MSGADIQQDLARFTPCPRRFTVGPASASLLGIGGHLRPIASMLCFLALAAAGCGEPNAGEQPSSALSELSRASQRLAANVAPCVVRIDVPQDNASGKADNDLSQLFGEIHDAVGQGSGIIVSTDGLILTNYHVVRDAKLARVTLDEDRTVTGTVVGVDALTDLALVRVPVQNLVPAKWGDSERLQPGQFVWAIGNPFGMQRSITFGILSARQGSGVTKSPFYDFLQTDAVVNPGNSGGPLVNSEGEIVGVTTTILGTSYQGVSFAIPSGTAREVVRQLRQEGKVSRGWLGATLVPVDAERARQAGLPRPHGVYVLALAHRNDAVGPAASAGLRPGDVILKWNGKTVEGVAQLARQVAAAPIGSNVPLSVFRQGRIVNITVQVAEQQ
jgi:serine protease Do